MKRYIILLLLTPATLFSQSVYQHWEWAKSFGGTGNDITSDIKVKNGYVYVTGTFTSPEITWESNTLTNNGGRDIFVAKLDTNGNTIWVKNFGGAGNDSVRQLEVNNNGVFVLLCQSASNTINIGGTSLTNPKSFFTKFDTDGNLLQGQVLHDSLTYQDIDIDNSGGIYVTCIYRIPFTFANNAVTQYDPVIPPAGAPVLYLDSTRYIYVDPQKAPDYYSSAALLKYNTNGSEEWIKLFHSSPQALFVEYDYSNNVAVCLFQHSSGLDFDNIYYNYSDQITDHSAFFLAGISPTSEVLYTNNDLGHGLLNGFQVDNSGLTFFSLYKLLHGPIPTDPYEFLNVYRNGQYQRGASSFPHNYDLSTLEAGEDGHTIYNSFDPKNNLFIADSTLITADSILIPDGTGLGLHKRSMAKNALYFGDTFNTDSIVIQNNSVPTFPVYTLHNHGDNDIFIGKFFTSGIPPPPPLRFTNFQDSIKFCNGINAFDLDSTKVIESFGSGNLSYSWQPAANFTHPDSLQTTIAFGSDTLRSTLTVTDKNGISISKSIVFYKGINADTRLVTADTLVCGTVLRLKPSNINLFLSGSMFEKCYAALSPGQSGKDTIQFNAINELRTYAAYSNHSIVLKSASSKYCFDTTAIKVIVKPVSITYLYKFLCRGSNYTFPNGDTIQNFKGDNIQDTSYLTNSLGCDSIIIVSLDVNTISLLQDVTICEGGNYTFPDGYTVTNVSAGLTYHNSHVTSPDGCTDSTINTYLTANSTASKYYPVYTVNCGSSFTFPDDTTITNIRNSITHVSHIKLADGCDIAIYYTSLVVTSFPVQTQDTIICSGNSYTFPDNTTFNSIRSDTTYTSHLTSISGCDSTIITHVSIHPAFTSSENISLCAGSSYTFPDNTVIPAIDTSVIYTSHFPSIYGCDSDIITHINIIASYSNSVSASICTGSDYTFPDNTILTGINTDVMHTSHFTSAYGCDSNVITMLHVTSLNTNVTKAKDTLNADLKDAAYQWLNCESNIAIPGETKQTFIALQKGSYAVQLLKDGCIDTSLCSIISDEDLFRENGSSSIKLYPVPARNTLTMTYTADVQTAFNIVISDVYGRTVLSNIVQLMPGMNTIKLNIASLEKGAYTVSLLDVSKQEKTIRKIVVN